MSKYNRVYNYSIGISLILYIGLIFLLNIVTPDRIFSDSENRNLEQRPRFSLNGLMCDKFTINYEKYISDQFALRDFWVGVKSDSEIIIGKKESNGVYLGKDGYLLQTFEKPSLIEVEKKVNAINDFVKSNKNINQYIMIVPNSVKVLESKLPKHAYAADELLYMNYVKSGLDSNIKYIDVYDALHSKNNDYIYYKTDHHWTTDGAYYGYKAAGNKMGFTPRDKSYFNIKKVTNDFYGTLYSKAGFKGISPDSINVYIPKKNKVSKVEYDDKRVSNSPYDMNSLSKKDKYTVFFGGNHPFMKIETKVNNSKKLLVIKDSYANCFIPFLANHYKEIYVVDLRYYDEDLKSLINKNGIDNMLILYNAKSFFEEDSISNLSS